MALELIELRSKAAMLHGPVLTFYLQTSPNSDDWKIRLKNGLKRTGEYVRASRQEELQLFLSIKKKVEKAVLDLQRHFNQGLVCFASQDEILLKPTQIPLENQFYWEKEPVVQHLDELFKLYPRTGIILVQRHRITLIDTLLAEILNETNYEIDLDTEYWRHYKGLSSGAIISSGATHRDKFDSRLKENQARWFKTVAPEIRKEAKNFQWEQVYLAGPPELTKEIKALLSHLNIVKVITQNYAGKSANEIVRDFLIKELTHI